MSYRYSENYLGAVYCIEELDILDVVIRTCAFKRERFLRRFSTQWEIMALFSLTSGEQF